MRHSTTVVARTSNMAALPVQTTTPSQLLLKPSKQALLCEYLGKPLNALRTPAAVIDRAVFAKNCARMHKNAKEWGASFRAHVKTHKVTTDCLIIYMTMQITRVDRRGCETATPIFRRQDARYSCIHFNGSP